MISLYVFFLYICFLKTALINFRFKTIIPIPEQSMIQMLCYLLEVMLTPENTPPDCPKDLYELYFVFACVWAFGGAMFQDQVRLCENLLSRDI